MINIIKSDFINNADNVIRFNGTFTFQKENISTHSFWVMFYCNIIFRKLFWNVFKSNNYYEIYNFLIRQAMFHDISDEVFTGDVLYNTKYHLEVGNEIKICLEKIALKEVQKIEDETLRNEMQAAIIKKEVDFLEYTHLSQEEIELCQIVLKLADWLSCYKFCLKEMKMQNNEIKIIIVTALNKIIETCNKLSEQIKRCEFDYEYNQLDSNNYIDEMINESKNEILIYE